MRVKCFGCGFDYEIKGTGEEMCPKCGCRHWHTRFTEYEKLHDEPEREKEEDLAFEIFDVFNNKKVNVRKIYLNGHIEGFEGDPCIINHMYPKFLRLRAISLDIIKQMNKDYRDLIERHLLADLPIDPIELSKLYQLYQAQLERIIISRYVYKV